MQPDILALLLIAMLPVAIAGTMFVFFRAIRQTKPLKLHHRLVGNVLVFVFLVSLLLLGGEFYYRFFYDTTDSFGLTKTNQRWLERHFQRNNWGIRDAVPYQAKAPLGKKRVTFLGDSFTAGHGVPDVADRFVNRIRAMKPQWDVQAIAICGWETGDQLMALDHLEDSYEFDRVVLVYCLNDICDISPEFQKLHAQLYQRQIPYPVRHSYLLNTLYMRGVAARLPQVANYYQGVQSSYEGPTWTAQRARLKQLRNEVHRRGGRLLVVTFPFLHRLGPSYDLQAVHDRLAAYWRELQVPHLDLLEPLRQRPPDQLMVHRRDPHPNELAHQLAAESMVEFLERHQSTKPQ